MQTPGVYLHHNSEIGEFFLNSDSVIATYRRWRAAATLIAQLPKADVERFTRIAYTIGGMLVFPSNKVDRRPTINGARGMHPQIADRIDLTLECIRRFYAGEAGNPLAEVLARYSEFFALFGDFGGYVDFFLLQDLVTPGHEGVDFLVPFAGFIGSPVPRDIETYIAFREASIHFAMARNARIDVWAKQHLRSA